jgi:hypothetical protein
VSTTNSWETPTVTTVRVIRDVAWSVQVVVPAQEVAAPRVRSHQRAELLALVRFPAIRRGTTVAAHAAAAR